MSVIGAEVDPSVGMSKEEKAKAEKARAAEEDGWSSDEDDGRRGRGKGKRGGARRGGGGGASADGVGRHRAREKVMKFFSTNNRRLWVLRECEKLGLLGPDGTVAVRLQRQDVSKRMVEKGTRSFRIERCTNEVTLVKVDKMPTAQELKEEAERNAKGGGGRRRRRRRRGERPRRGGRGHEGRGRQTPRQPRGVSRLTMTFFPKVCRHRMMVNSSSPRSPLLVQPRHAQVLHLQVLLQPVLPALAPDPALAHPAEGRRRG